MSSQKFFVRDPMGYVTEIGGNNSRRRIGPDIDEVKFELRMLQAQTGQGAKSGNQVNLPQGAAPNVGGLNTARHPPAKTGDHRADQKALLDWSYANAEELINKKKLSKRMNNSFPNSSGVSVGYPANVQAERAFGRGQELANDTSPPPAQSGSERTNALGRRPKTDLPGANLPQDNKSEYQGGTTFIGGAGVQVAQQGDYIKSFKTAFEEAGIRNVHAPSSQDPTFLALGLDALSVPRINDVDFARSLIGSEEIEKEVQRSLNKGDNQYNLAGYSYGSAAAASAALAIAESGGKIDNLILIGAPINADLWEAIHNTPGIENVINVDLDAYGDPVQTGLNDWDLASKVPELIQQMLEGGNRSLLL